MGEAMEKVHNYISVIIYNGLQLPPWESQPIIIELLNQLENNNHHCCRLTLRADHDRNVQFIAHSALSYNPSPLPPLTCMYLHVHCTWYSYSYYILQACIDIKRSRIHTVNNHTNRLGDRLYIVVL